MLFLRCLCPSGRGRRSDADLPKRSSFGADRGSAMSSDATGWKPPRLEHAHWHEN